MEKVYLKYDDVRPCVQCDYGFVKEILYMGFLYPYKKKDYKFFGIILTLQLCVISLMVIIVPFPFWLLLSIIFVVFINLLFALNYNLLIIEQLLKEGYYPMDYSSSDKLIKKGIYFKLQ